ATTPPAATTFGSATPGGLPADSFQADLSGLWVCRKGIENFKRSILSHFISSGGLQLSTARASLGGGCFYPSVWLAALHSLRKGHAKRLAYVDIDAHMPDGVWKEVDHFSKLKKDQRDFLIGKRNSCTGILFSSIHIDGYPNQGSSWHSVKQNLKRSFEVRVRDTLLPRSVTQGTASSANQGLITRYQRWCNTLDKEMTSFQPDGLFVGLGFDLHQKEAEISDKK
ncbi:unnamed protein product, partial [Symbiodinium necroappetens]